MSSRPLLQQLHYRSSDNVQTV